MNVQRLVANDPEDCRGLINTLVNNGYLVWMSKVFDVEGRKTSTVVFYVSWKKSHDIDDSISAIPEIGPDFLKHIQKIWDDYEEFHE